MPSVSTDHACGRWYAIQCKAKESFRAEENLSNQGFEVFHPTFLIRKKRRGVLVRVVEPLFPYYLFIYLDQLHSNWRPIRSTRGVSRIVAFGDQPAVIDDALVAALKVREQHREPGPLFEQGQAIAVESGPFAGYSAVFQQLQGARNGEERAIILLQWLNRTQAVEVPVSHLMR